MRYAPQRVQYQPPPEPVVRHSPAYQPLPQPQPEAPVLPIATVANPQPAAVAAAPQLPSPQQPSSQPAPDLVPQPEPPQAEQPFAGQSVSVDRPIEAAELPRPPKVEEVQPQPEQPPAPPVAIQPVVPPVTHKETKAERDQRLASEEAQRAKDAAKKAEVAAKKAGADARKAQLQAQREEVYVAHCGAAPTRSGWDGSLTPVRHFLNRVAHDPDSIEFAHDQGGIDGCTVPQLTQKKCWTAICKFRGKNALGALVLNTTRFYMTNTEVIGTGD